MTTSPRRSLLFDQGQSEGDRALRDYYLSIGLNPDQPNEALVGQEGLSSSFGRNTSRMLDRPLNGAGARVLTPAEMNAAWSLQKRNPGEGGSFYDNMNDPSNHSVTAKYWADTVRPTIARDGGGTQFDNRREVQRRVATFGYDPQANPQDQARSIGERIYDEKQRQNFVRSGIVNKVHRTLGDLQNMFDGPDSGGTMRTVDGRRFEVPTGGERARPVFDQEAMDAAPVTGPVEAAMTPQQFIKPVPLAAGLRAQKRKVTPIEDTRPSFPSFHTPPIDRRPNYRFAGAGG